MPPCCFDSPSWVAIFFQSRGSSAFADLIAGFVSRDDESVELPDDWEAMVFRRMALSNSNEEIAWFWLTSQMAAPTSAMTGGRRNEGFNA